MLRRVGLVEVPAFALVALEGHHVQHDAFLCRRLRLVRQVFAGTVEGAEVLAIDPLLLLQVGLVFKVDMPSPAPARVVTVWVLLDGPVARNPDALKCDVLRVNGKTRWRCRAVDETNRPWLFSRHRVLRRSSVTTILITLSRHHAGRPRSCVLCRRILYLFIKMNKTWLEGRESSI